MKVQRLRDDSSGFGVEKGAMRGWGGGGGEVSLYTRGNAKFYVLAVPMKYMYTS